MPVIRVFDMETCPEVPELICGRDRKPLLAFGFLKQDVKIVVNYMDSLGDGDGQISFDELEKCFRR